MVKNSLANIGDAGDSVPIPGSGRFPWTREWQPTPVFLPEKSYGQKSLAGYSPRGRKELDTTEATEGQQQRTGEVVFYRSPSKTFLSEF